MAEYHMHMGYISRKGGRSTTAHSAYIGCTRLEETRTGIIFDYSKKKGLLHQGILAPEGCPDWVYDRELLWNSVEAFEDQLAQNRFRGHTNPQKHEKSLQAKETFLKSCKTGYTAIFALPLEMINPQDQIDLSERIVKACYVQKGLIADYAVHGDKGNPHLHILATTRPWENGNYSEKRFVLEREQLIEMRHLAADITNEFGREKGYNYLVDARSYEDRGLTLKPTRHLGPNAHHKLQDGSRIVQENKDIHQENLLILMDRPEEIIKSVVSKKVVFTKADLEKEIFKRAGGDMTLYSLLKTRLEGMDISSELLKTANDNFSFQGEELEGDYHKVLSSYAAQLQKDHTIEIGKTLKNEKVFTTQQTLDLEKNVQASLQTLKEREGSNDKIISEDIKKTAILKAEDENDFLFSKEQRKAIDYLLSSSALRVLTGRAGSGKTTILKPVVEAYQEAGFIPQGVAFQGNVAEHLSLELDIPSHTLDQLRTYWAQYEKVKEELPSLKGKALQIAQKELTRLAAYRFTDRHVVFLDEGNMVGGNLWQNLLSHVQDTGATLRVVQDNNQIKTLYGLDISRMVEEAAGHIALTEVYRQKEKWMQHASFHLNNHDLSEGIKPYEERGCLTFKASQSFACYALAEAYVNNLTKSPECLHVALAFRNRDVEELNGMIRHHLKERGSLGESLSFKEREFAVGDLVLFTTNDHKERFVKTIQFKTDSHRKGVKNGTYGTIESLDEARSLLYIRLTKDKRLIEVDLKTYDHLDYGYAMTTNKAEGKTFDYVYGLFDPLMSANKLLIWMTRHRIGFQGFISKEHASHGEGMAMAVGRSEYCPLLSDFKSLPEQKSFEADLVRKYLASAYESGNLWGRISQGANEPTLQLSSTLTSFKDMANAQISPYENAVRDDFQATQFERNQLAGEILDHWAACQTFVNQAGLKKITLEVQAGLKERQLSEVELEALQRVETYREVASIVREMNEEIKVLTKTHPLIKKYEDQVQIRNQLAYEIVTFPELHRPFFKMTKKEESYVSYGGEVYTSPPASLKAAQRHSQAYIKTQHQALFREKLTAIQKGAFDDLLDFKKQVRVCGRLAGALKDNPSPENSLGNKPEDASLRDAPPRDTSLGNTTHEGSSPRNSSSTDISKSSLVKQETLRLALEEASKERDLLAFKIINSFEKYGSLLERADVALCQTSQDRLLRYAVFGEVRQLALKHSLVKSVERRLELANQLHKMVMGDGKKDQCDKALYGILKSMDVDISRLRFEKSCLEMMKNKDSFPFKTIPELASAFISLNECRTTHQEAHANKQQYINHNSIVKSQGTYPLIEAKAVEEVLKQNMAGFADDIFSSLGEPFHKGSSSTINRRYGMKGHISVNLRTGQWIDFKNSELKGGPLHMLTKLKGFSFKEAIEYGASWAGLTPEKIDLFRSQLPSFKQEERQALEREAEEKKQKIKKAQALWQRAKPIEGTLAERYLREHRKIESELPQNLRHLPAFKDSRSGNAYPPCLVAVAKSMRGEVRAVQLTYLDSQTAAKAKLEVTKRSHGLIRGSAVTLQEDKTSNLLFIAEGVETALSIKEAGVKGTIKASLGLSNIGLITPENPNTHIVICADHDAPDSPAANSLEKSVLALQKKEYRVTVIKPDKLNEDFNDVLKTQGPQKVREILEKGLPSLKAPQKEAAQVESLGSHKKAIVTKEQMSPALQAIYEEWKQPAFKNAVTYREAFEEARKMFGEAEAIKWWGSQRTEILENYQQKLKQLKRNYKSPMFREDKQEGQMDYRKSYEEAKLKHATLNNESYLRFKALTRDLEKTLSQDDRLQEEHRVLGISLSQNKAWFENLKQYDEKTAKAIEQIGKNHERERALSVERGGFSI